MKLPKQIHKNKAINLFKMNSKGSYIIKKCLNSSKSSFFEYRTLSILKIHLVYNNLMTSQEAFFIVKRCPAQENTPTKPQGRRPSVYSWNERQNSLYLQFIKDNQVEMEEVHHRRSKIFKKMEKYIKTRTSIQIKSHHQKILLKYGSIKAILTNLCLKETQIQHPNSQEDNQSHLNHFLSENTFCTHQGQIYFDPSEEEKRMELQDEDWFFQFYD